jgi:nitrogen fixation protein FixH
MSVIAAQHWKRFPHYMLLAMGLVIAVNVRFIYVAVTTFPGAATNDDFDTSNRYNKVLDAAAAQDALGWQETVTTQGRKAVFDLRGHDHAPLTGATLVVQAQRPLGAAPAQPLAVQEITPGHHVAITDLSASGQWDLVLRITQGGHVARVTRRVIVQ